MRREECIKALKHTNTKEWLVSSRTENAAGPVKEIRWVLERLNGLVWPRIGAIGELL
jgi:hypothetical protein